MAQRPTALLGDTDIFIDYLNGVKMNLMAESLFLRPLPYDDSPFTLALSHQGREKFRSPTPALFQLEVRECLR